MPQLAPGPQRGQGGIVVAPTRRGKDALPPAQRTSKGWEARMDNELSPLERVRSGSGLPPHRWTKVDDPQSEAVIAAHPAVIAGGGPAGLTAAYELTRHRHGCVVLEAD